MQAQFNQATVAQLEGNKLGYYSTIREIFTKSMIKKLVAFGYDIKDYEDLSQQIQVELFEVVSKLDKVTYTVKEAVNGTASMYNDKTGTVVEVGTVEYIYKKVVAPWTEVPSGILWNKNRDAVKSRLYKYFNTKSISVYASIDNTADIGALSGEYSDRQLSLMDRIEDISATLEYSTIGTIESLKGSLSKSEYDYLVSWYTVGIRPYDSSKMVNKVRAKVNGLVKSGEISKEDISATLNKSVTKDLLLLDIEKVTRIENKLYKLTR